MKFKAGQNRFYFAVSAINRGLEEAKAFLQFLILSSIGKRTKQIMCYCPIDARFFLPIQETSSRHPKTFNKIKRLVISSHKDVGHASNSNPDWTIACYPFRPFSN